MSDPVHESRAVVQRIILECSKMEPEQLGKWGVVVYELACALESALDELHHLDYERRLGVPWDEYAEAWVKRKDEAIG